ncbi:uroporphyrinogen-III synthase [Catellatospora coxensis]|uniref:Uroporphyrinogen III methyltransferase n=1 Tax=Catellatospora coxensis TaxID=310354 RepID=A0A8J3PAC3_9ACTN|nr:uroporphyrinogen-III synthase [Catellatospora coxensis]GIG09258.1 uroporphyrinogen III methyltransferase [Catellatospora coxensis]
MLPQPRKNAPDPPPVGALAGFVVAVLSELRRHPMAATFTADGARVVSGQPVRTIAQPVEQTLHEATMTCLTRPIGHLVVTASVEFNYWMAVVRSWRLDVPLLARFAHARLLASNPRCADALRSLGFTDISSAVDNTTEGLVMHLRHRLPPGQTIALQLKTPAMHDLAHSLREAGHEVVAVPTFQVLPSNSPDLMRRLVGQVVRRQVDAIALTSAEVARSLLWYARTGDQFDELCQALATGVTAVCLGPLTAAPLRELDIPVRVADAPYTDQLAQAVRAVLRERVHRIETGPHTIEIRGEAVLLDGRLIALQQGPLALLRLLADHPDRVLSPADVRRKLPFWAGADDHAIEMAVSRLRRSLPGVDLVQTVMKRGYRLAEHRRLPVADDPVAAEPDRR